jgi:hypothetical protein
VATFRLFCKAKWPNAIFFSRLKTKDLWFASASFAAPLPWRLDAS